jgi:hypothetical protein
MRLTKSFFAFLAPSGDNSIALLDTFPNGNAVYGTGNMNQGTNTTLQAAASDTVTGYKLNLI